jgi:hypothetical protein
VRHPPFWPIPPYSSGVPHESLSLYYTPISPPHVMLYALLSPFLVIYHIYMVIFVKKFLIN